MKEIEAKFLEIDAGKVIKTLENLGAKRTFDDAIDSYAYDFPDRSISKRDELLRLRKKGSLVEFAYKEKIKSKKAVIRNEIEVHVEDFEKMREILCIIGLKEIRHIRKTRITYAIGDVHFEIDSVEGIPTYLEIEATSVKKLRKAIALIGFSMKDAKLWTTKNVLKYYNKPFDI